MRTSIAWLAAVAARSPAAMTASLNGEPAAIRSCSRTMSTPATSSVTPCSTCSRVLTSRNQKLPSGSWRNSQVAALRRPASRPSRIARPWRCRRCASLSPGAGASSTSFWCRRCSEQSRSPRATTAPSASARSWTSMCRAGRISRSRYTDPSPNADAASREPLTSAAGRSSGRVTRRMPRPPPPAAALTSNGKPIRSAVATIAAIWSGRSIGAASRVPGTDGTSTRAASRRAFSLSPSASIVPDAGPTKTRPASSTALANAARSARNPYPGWIASAPVSRAASTIASIRR